MANADTPNGFVPFRHLLGGCITINRMGTYAIASALAESICSGDLIKRATTSNNISKGAASDTAFLGVFAGVEYTDVSGNRVFKNQWLTGTVATEVVAHVYDDPYISFSVQHDGTGAVTDYGAMADVLATTGNTATGISKMELDTSNIGTGINLKILGTIADPSNAVGANQRVEVLVNEHELRAVVTSV